MPSRFCVHNADRLEETQKGFRHSAQGCHTRLPWGEQRFGHNPKGVPSFSPRLPYSATLGGAAIRSQPQRGCAPLKRRVPKVAEYSNPWALSWNPVGVAN